ncbi:hypothetical protein BBW65_01690 [Helicobacter enhydrae]|uniref:Uncharacterized protein n=1 Tax=Helicobacter enhydrae TaxID=222136 RepID=A0A1B1U4B8_9HELI|nr:hypothetical protein [Helicobacter enhydrae]ANV97596.1 hypothetical protein BBW65_01690 [Helicobacter enhydrae]
MEGFGALNRVLKLYYLHQLLAFGEEFTHDILMPPKTQTRTESLGQNPKDARIGFITKTPLLDSQGNFLPKQSGEILQKIIANVFKLNPKKCSILSFFKTDVITNQSMSEDAQYRKLLLTQISQSTAKVFIIFDLQIANILLATDIKQGVPCVYGQKTFIATHSLTALLKLPALKRETFADLNTAKEFL